MYRIVLIYAVQWVQIKTENRYWLVLPKQERSWSRGPWRASPGGPEAGQGRRRHRRADRGPATRGGQSPSRRASWRRSRRRWRRRDHTRRRWRGARWSTRGRACPPAGKKIARSPWPCSSYAGKTAVSKLHRARLLRRLSQTSIARTSRRI